MTRPPLYIAYIALLLILSSCMGGNVVTSKVLYKTGTIKMEAWQKTDVKKNELTRREKTYYKSGVLKSEIFTIENLSKSKGLDKDPGHRFVSIKQRKDKYYYENGKLKERGEMKNGNGKIYEYNLDGKLTQIKIIRLYRTIEIIDK